MRLLLKGIRTIAPSQDKISQYIYKHAYQHWDVAEDANMCLCVYWFNTFMYFSLSEKELFLDSFTLFSIHKNRTSSSVRANHMRKRVQCSTFRDVIHWTKIPTNCLQEINPVGQLTSNGRLLNVHIRPVDVQKGRSMDV